MKDSDLSAFHSAVYPANKHLDYPTLVARLGRFADLLHATESRRRPRADAHWRLLAKANIGTDEFPTTAGSLALKNLHVPDAHIVTLLKKANCDIFGKASMTELANFVTTGCPLSGYSQLGGFPKNPWGPFLPGGSSSGSAVAVAAGLCDAALGTETSGSLMIPGLKNGVWAIKPTRGLLSRTGIVPITHYFDSPGVLARDLNTGSEIIRLATGRDERDPATQTIDKIDLVGGNPERPLRLGLLTIEGKALDSQTRELLRTWLPKETKLIPLTAKGVLIKYREVTSLSIREDLDYFLKIYGSADTPRSFDELLTFYREHPETHPFGMDRLELAASMPPIDKRDLDSLAEQQITNARNAIDERMDNNELDAILFFDFVNWWAVSGSPSIAIPLGCKPSGEPIGCIVGGRWGHDGDLLCIAKQLDKKRNHANLAISSGCFSQPPAALF